MQSTIPKLFGRVPRGLFGPLGDPYAELYWDLLANLYQYEFEREPFLVLRQTAFEIAERVILEHPFWAVRRQDLETLIPGTDRETLRSNGADGKNRANSKGDDPQDEHALLRSLARRTLGRLEGSGWIHFQYRAGAGEIMSFHPYAARVLETLLKVARDDQPLFQGYVHSIAALLDPKAFASKPGLSLAEAKRHTLELVRELKILERNIHLFTQRILEEAATAANVLEEGFERYEHAVMANYHRLKTVDNVYRQRTAILERLDAIERDEIAIGAAVDWYAAQSGSGAADARIRVSEDIAILRSRFDAIPELIEEIDTRNARFSGVALRKIRYFLRQDRRTEGQLQFIVDALARGEGPEIEFDVYKCELLGDGFLYTPPTERPKLQPQTLQKNNKANFEDIRQHALKQLRRRFSRGRVEDFVKDFLRGRLSADMQELSVDSDEDYIRLFYLSSNGLDGRSSFRFSPSGETLRNKEYGYPAGRIERTESKRRQG